MEGTALRFGELGAVDAVAVGVHEASGALRDLHCQAPEGRILDCAPNPEFEKVVDGCAVIQE